MASPSLEEARRRVRAAKGTFYGWLKDTVFQTELKRQREALVKQVFNRLKASLNPAIDKLLALLETQGNPNIQLRAAQILLDNGIKAVELHDHEHRLEALEETVATHRGRAWR